MKRTILLICISSLSAVAIFAQSLSLVYLDEVVDNDSVFITGESTIDLIEWQLNVKNLTNKDIEVMVKKTEILLIDNTVNTFCWGSCFIPSVFISPVPVNIPANTTDSISFAGDYEPGGMEGTSIISYTFFNAQNENDYVMVTAFYQAGTSGIYGPDFGAGSISIFPNPVVDELNIEFDRPLDKPCTIRLYGLNGQLLEELANQSFSRIHHFSMEGIASSCIIIEVAEKGGRVYRKKILTGN